MEHREPKDWITFALDVPHREAAIALIEELGPVVGGFKIGSIPIGAGFAHELIARLRGTGHRIVMDPKLHDIPSTMRDAAAAWAAQGVHAITVHALAGSFGITAAVDGVGGTTTQIIGVTVLTSHSEEQCHTLFARGTAMTAIDLARELVRGYADGIVCSPAELHLLQQIAQRGQRGIAECPDDTIDRTDAAIGKLHTMIPGIRPAWAPADDQHRSLTPTEAIQLGAQELVIGRPIRNPPPHIGSRIVAAQRIAAEIEAGLIAREQRAS